MDPRYYKKNKKYNLNKIDPLPDARTKTTSFRPQALDEAD